jgi:hypothetical protein
LSVKRTRRLLALSVSLFLFSVYLFVYRGGFHSIDEVSMFAVTESLVKFGRFNTDQIAWTQWTTTQAEAQGFFGRDGHVYSKKGLALSLAQAPLYWLALTLPGLGMLQTVSLLNATVTAATALLLFMFAQRLGFAKITAAAVALIYGLATIAFVYAKYLFSEPLAGLLLLLAAYMLFVYRQEGGRLHIAIAGLAAGGAVVARANNLFLLPVFGLYLLWTIYKPAPPRPPNRAIATWISPVTIFMLSLAVPGTILLAYNAARSGNPFQTGYDLTLFSPNLLLGLYKLLFSPLRGLFVYSPILLLSLPGWWVFRKTYAAEAWLFAGLVGITLGLFSAWSSGEGLSWGSRFLVPIVPFFVIVLAPLLPAPSTGLRVSLYILLPLSGFIQILGVSINPWIFLARLQADFGGEFFLENTAALYDFRYSQIVGQLQAWSLQNSDLIWWQPAGFDLLAFSLSLSLVLLSGWTLWRVLAQPPRTLTPHPTTPVLLAATAGLALVITYLLLARYFITDQRQFGPPNDPYTRALNRMLSRAKPGDRAVTVAQEHYHIPMNRFKARVPLIGLAQQSWPPPETMVPLLEQATSGPAVWLVTIGFPPAAPDNAAERWLAFNTFKAGDSWLEDARLVRYSTVPPAITRPIHRTLDRSIELVTIRLLDPLQPGQLLPVEFHWLPLEPLPANYNLFLQLLTPDGSLVAQHDSPPNGGYTPTSTWPAGQPVSSHHALALPPDLPPGDYRLIAGLYNPATGRRLPVDTGHDLVELGSLTIIDQITVTQQQ